MQATITPYCEVDGVRNFPDSYMVDELYARMVIEGKVASVFYSGSVQGSASFLRLLRREDNRTFLFHDDARRPLGFFWVNEFDGPSARAHFCFFKEASGRGRVLVNMGLRYLLAIEDNEGRPALDCLRGVTPVSNAPACNMVLKAGMMKVGIMPKRIWNYWTNQAEDALYTYCTRESLAKFDLKEGRRGRR